MTVSTKEMERILAGIGSSARHATLRTTPTHSLTQGEVQEKLVGMGKCEGWVCFTDEVVVVKGVLGEEELKARAVLSAELCAGGTTLTVRQSGGGWSCWLVESVSGDGTEDFVEVEEFLGGKEFFSKSDVRLRYEVCWRATVDVNDVARYVPVVSRFAGFAGDGNVEVTS
jgi:hypothetical protein